MRSDKIFYRIFQQHPSLAFTLLGQSPPEPYCFQSPVVKEKELRLDGLLLPISRNPDLPFILVECQMQPDPGLYYRILSEFSLYLQQYNCPNPWQVLVIYGDSSLERKVPQQEQICQFLNLQCISLDQLEIGVSLLQDALFILGAEPERALAQANVMVQQARVEILDGLERRDFIELIADIITRKFPGVGDQEIRQMLQLAELEHTKAFQEGIQEGIQEGRREGQWEAKAEAVPRLLSMGLSVTQVAEALDISQGDVLRLTSGPSPLG